jgi:anti-anti-sigma factor
MKIDVHRMGSVTVVSPRGAIAQDDVDEFEATTENARKKTNGRIVIDLSQVPYFDSRGVEVLWDLTDRQREAGHTMRVAAAPELCREILELTRISEHLDLFDSPESAVRSLL